MTTKPRFRLTALCAALAGAWGPALAQEQPADAHPGKGENFVSIGAGYWTEDRPRFGVYDGMRDKGAYGLLDALIIRRDDATGTWLNFDGRNLGLDSRSFRAEWLRQGDIGVSIEYNQLPYNSPFTVMTAVQGLGTPIQLVPTPSAPVLGQWTVGTMREAWTAGFFKSLGGGTDLRVTLKNEHKEGGRLWGRGGAAEFATEPIDSDTRQLEAVLSHAGKAFQIQGGYYGSWYTNRNAMVSTANVNPTFTTLTNPYFLSLPLDNQAQQLYLNGGYNFTESTRGSFKLAYTHATQDEDIPVGPGVPVFAGAPTNLNGRLDTTLAQLGLTSRTTNAFSWAASLRYYNSDEKTPQYRVVQPAGGCGTCVDSTPLGFKTLTGKLEGTYRFTPGLATMLGVEYSDQDRRVPFGGPVSAATGADSQRYVPWRAELQETTIYVQGRRMLSETLNGWIRYSHSKRDGSEFTLTNEAQSELINPIHIADRDRDKFRLMVDWAPVTALQLTFNAEYAQDNYGHSDARPYGLRDGQATLYSIDATYAISENWQMSAWYSRDNTKANQFGQRNANGGAAEATKEANLEDTGDTFGAGVKGIFTSRVKAGLDLLYVKNVNKYPETVTPTGAGTLYPSSGGVVAVGPLPDIQNTAARLKLYATYALQKRSEVRFDYIHEVWKTDDWTWLFANGSTFTYGATTDGTQVSQAPKQTSNFFGARYIYRFQ